MIVDTVSAILMGLFMGIATTLINQTPLNWVTLLDAWGDITIVILLISIVIPLNDWGCKFAELLRCKPGTIVFTLVANILPTCIINTVLAAVLPALGIFYNEAIPKEDRMGTWVSIFIGGWLLTFVIAFFLSLLAAKVGKIIAAKSLNAPTT